LIAVLASSNLTPSRALAADRSLYARLCRRYPPEAVEAICWIPRTQVEEAARLIWHSRPVSYYAWSGHEQHANVTQTARAMSLLYALTGSFDQPGGNVLEPIRRWALS
jgi:anaerobic selenocysteine-containing dehydrogenase